MTYYKNSPIRINKIKEIHQKLTDLKLEQKRKFTPRENIYHIFAYRFKHFDTEEEEEEKGVSLRELALILYPDRVTVEQMIASEEDPIFSQDIWPILQNIKQSISRFKKWRQSTIGEDEQSPDETGFNLYCLRTKKGHYYYYNLMNDKDLEFVEKHRAKMHLGLQKSINKALDILEMRPEEREAKTREVEKEILERKRKREERRKQNSEKNKTGDLK